MYSICVLSEEMNTETTKLKIKFKKIQVLIDINFDVFIDITYFMINL